MPKLIIDNMEVDVPEGTNVLEAAKKVGVVIPHFCYHPALEAVGACRLCAMKFVAGPVKGVQMSCMTKAMDGMVVSTTDGEAAKLRKMVIEWLMVNHPHDCPVCDEGGMCLLQDYTEAGGHGIRRYKGKKRVFADQYLGGFIQHEMNRCIQCYRCARFYQDYAGGEDFGPMQTANRVYFGRVEEGWLESPFSGNLADVCPTGVLTDKTSRFKTRPWDLTTAPSVCPHCSLGCNVEPGGRYRELVRVKARENRMVNGWFICDRGRFGHGFTSSPERPRTPLVDGAGASREDALRAAADRLFATIERFGGDAVALLGSPRASVETSHAAAHFASVIGSKNLCFSADPPRERKDTLAVSLLRRVPSRSLAAVAESDVIVALCADPLNEAPMLALMMRQAARDGAKVFVIDPRPIALPFEFTHIHALPDDVLASIDASVMGALAAATRPTVIAGTDVGTEDIITHAAEVAEKLARDGADAGLLYIMAGPNSFGAALMSAGTTDFDKVLDGIQHGRIKTLIVSEATPLAQHPNLRRVRAAFDKLDSLIAIDYLPTGSVNRADVFIPSLAYAEDEGVFVNNEGRAQLYARAYTAGTPVNYMGPDSHPPREFFEEVPGGAEPAWRTLFDILCLLRPECPPQRSASGVRHMLAGADPFWSPITGLVAGSEGSVLRLPERFETTPAVDTQDAHEEGLVLVTTELVFGTEELSFYSEHIDPKVPEPYIVMNRDDAGTLGLAPGELVEVGNGQRALECTLRVSDNVVRGAVIAPRICGWPINRLSGGTVHVRRLQS